MSNILDIIHLEMDSEDETAPRDKVSQDPVPEAHEKEPQTVTLDNPEPIVDGLEPPKLHNVFPNTIWK